MTLEEIAEYEKAANAIDQMRRALFSSNVMLRKKIAEVKAEKRATPEQIQKLAISLMISEQSELEMNTHLLLIRGRLESLKNAAAGGAA